METAIAIILLLCSALGFLAGRISTTKKVEDTGGSFMLGFLILVIIAVMTGIVENREANLERNGTTSDTTITIKSGVADTVVTHKIIYK